MAGSFLTVFLSRHFGISLVSFSLESPALPFSLRCTKKRPSNVKLLSEIARIWKPTFDDFSEEGIGFA